MCGFLFGGVGFYAKGSLRHKLSSKNKELLFSPLATVQIILTSDESSTIHKFGLICDFLHL